MRNRRNSKHYPVDLSHSFADIAYRLEDKTPVNQGYHYHAGYEILQIWSDKGHVLVEDRIYPMKSGGIYIINALESHCTNPDPRFPYVRSKITFSAPYINKLLEQMGQLCLLEPFAGAGVTNCIIPHAEMAGRIDGLFKRISEESRLSSDSSPALVNAGFLEMLALLYRWYCENMEKSPSHAHQVNGHVKGILDYINKHLFDDITIEKLCENLHLSKYYLCHLFKDATGLTVMNYITERRISEAKKALTASIKPVSYIADQTGFESFSVFSRTFKRVTGFTPLGYRKRFGIPPTAFSTSLPGEYPPG